MITVQIDEAEVQQAVASVAQAALVAGIGTYETKHAVTAAVTKAVEDLDIVRMLEVAVRREIEVHAMAVVAQAAAEAVPAIKAALGEAIRAALVRMVVGMRAGDFFTHEERERLIRSTYTELFGVEANR